MQNKPWYVGATSEAFGSLDYAVCILLHTRIRASFICIGVGRGISTRGSWIICSNPGSLWSKGEISLYHNNSPIIWWILFSSTSWLIVHQRRRLKASLCQSYVNLFFKQHLLLNYLSIFEIIFPECSHLCSLQNCTNGSAPQNKIATKLKIEFFKKKYLTTYPEPPVQNQNYLHECSQQNPLPK